MTPQVEAPSALAVMSFGTGMNTRPLVALAARSAYVRRRAPRSAYGGASAPRINRPYSKATPGRLRLPSPNLLGISR